MLMELLGEKSETDEPSIEDQAPALAPPVKTQPVVQRAEVKKQSTESNSCAEMPADKPEFAAEKPEVAAEKPVKPTLEKPNVTRGPAYESYLMLMELLGENPDKEPVPEPTAENQPSIHKTDLIKPIVLSKNDIEKSADKPEVAAEKPIKPTLEKPNVTRGPAYESYLMLTELLGEEPEKESAPEPTVERQPSIQRTDLKKPTVMQKTETEKPVDKTEIAAAKPGKETKPTLEKPNVTSGPAYESYLMLMALLGEDPNGPNVDVEKQDFKTKSIENDSYNNKSDTEKQATDADLEEERIRKERALEIAIADRESLRRRMISGYKELKDAKSEPEKPASEVTGQGQSEPEITRNEMPVSETDPVKFTGLTDQDAQRYEAVRQLTILIAAEHLDAIPYPVFSAMSVQEIIGLIETVPEKIRKELIKPEPPRHEPPSRGRSCGIDI
jgi:hypothetical protein